ncbi:hypothetical protein [Azospirillum sp. sgz301742]
MTALNIPLPDPHFDFAVQAIAHRLNPCGFDVSDDAPQDYEAMLHLYNTTGRICVWSGASGRTIFGDPEVNYAFRAWHDWCHIKAHLPFTTAGEHAAAALQCSHIKRFYGVSLRTQHWCQLVDAEVIGQRRYFERHHRFPVDQRAFDLTYIQQGPEVALGRTF